MTHFENRKQVKKTEQLSSKELKPYVEDFMEICISKHIFV